MTSLRPAPRAGEVARGPVLGSVLIPGQLLPVPWQVLGQLLPGPWRLLMLLAIGRVRQRGQEGKQWSRVIAGVRVY
jgi:hypothetical protein